LLQQCFPDGKKHLNWAVMNFGRKRQEAEDAVRAWLESSEIPVGGRLPSERTLARDLGVPHSVLNRVVGRLIGEGRLERRGYCLLRGPDDPGAAVQAPCDLVLLQRSRRLANLRKVALDLRVPLREHLAASADEMPGLLAALKSAPPESVILVPPRGDDRAVWEPAARELAAHGVSVICLGQRAEGLPSVASSRGLEQIVVHLADLGHAELALLVASPWTEAVSEATTRWGELCRRFASAPSGERVIHQHSSHMLREDIVAIADQFEAEWPNVTALVIATDDDLPIQRLLDAFRRRKIVVPQRLSLISLFDHPALPTASPPVAAAMEDLALEHETAFLLAQRARRFRHRLGLTAPLATIDIALDINARKSLVPNPKAPSLALPLKPPAGSSPLSIAGSLLISDDPVSAGTLPYELVQEAAPSRFQMLDLAENMNRPLNFRRGWLGDLPLSSLPPGKHTFHGVPFQILGGATRRDRAAIVFQSLRNTTGSTARLPTRVRIPVGRNARAIYVLHGCGYVKSLARFGSYRFFGCAQKLGDIPLVALGHPQPGAETWEFAEAILQANIQDWWPDFPHCNFRQARMVPLPDSRSGGPVRGHIFLYSLEWINPAPEVPVSHIEIETDPDQSTTLGVLAVTVMRP
jgi:hypothetical protein